MHTNYYYVESTNNLILFTFFGCMLIDRFELSMMPRGGVMNVALRTNMFELFWDIITIHLEAINS